MRARYSYGPPPVLERRHPRPRQARPSVPEVAVRPMPEVLWGVRRENRMAPKEHPADAPYALAPPAPEPLGLADVADPVPEPAPAARPRRRSPRLRIKRAEEPPMTEAEVAACAADFVRWRARHLQLHRH